MRVLLAVDGSDDAVTATNWLRRFPLPPSTKALVVTVASIPPSALDVPPVRAFKHELAEAARHVADDACATLGRHWSDVEAIVLEGDAREKILRTADAWNADMVVVGARGLGAVKGFLLGSVSTDVARYAHCAVLVVKGRPAPLRRALVAIDGSTGSITAARFFGSLPLDGALTIRLLMAIERPRYPTAVPGILAAPLAAAVEHMLSEEKEAAEKILNRVVADFVGRVAIIEPEVIGGHPSDESFAPRPNRTSVSSWPERAVSGESAGWCSAASPKKSSITSTVRC